MKKTDIRHIRRSDTELDRFAEENERFADRSRNKTKEQKAAYFAFRALLWKAIDEKNENFSIVETAIALGLYERKK